jgi:hypothetical protein
MICYESNSEFLEIEKEIYPGGNYVIQSLKKEKPIS